MAALKVFSFDMFGYYGVFSQLNYRVFSTSVIICGSYRIFPVGTLLHIIT
jgi:hypothetical protein